MTSITATVQEDDQETKCPVTVTEYDGFSELKFQYEQVAVSLAIVDPTDSTQPGTELATEAKVPSGDSRNEPLALTISMLAEDGESNELLATPPRYDGKFKLRNTITFALERTEVMERLKTQQLTIKMDVSRYSEEMTCSEAIEWLRGKAPSLNKKKYIELYRSMIPKHQKAYSSYLKHEKLNHVRWKKLAEFRREHVLASPYDKLLPIQYDWNGKKPYDHALKPVHLLPTTIYEKCELNSKTLIVRGRTNYAELYSVTITAGDNPLFTVSFKITPDTKGKLQVKLIADTKAVEPYAIELSGTARSGKKQLPFRCELRSTLKTYLFQSLIGFVNEDDLERDPRPDLLLYVMKNPVRRLQKPERTTLNSRRRRRKDRF